MADEDDELTLIPREVREKLDRVGIKLHLQEWQQLTLSDRQRLLFLPVSTDAELEEYRHWLSNLVLAVTGRPPTLLPSKP